MIRYLCFSLFLLLSVVSAANDEITKIAEGKVRSRGDHALFYQYEVEGHICVAVVGTGASSNAGVGTAIDCFAKPKDD